MADVLVGTDTDVRTNRRLEAAFWEEQRASLKLRVKVIACALAALSISLLIASPKVETLYYVAVCAIITALTYVQWRLRDSPYGKRWQSYAFVLLFVAILAHVLLAPNPLSDIELPPQMALRQETFPYFYLFLVLSALSYSPALVVWTGVITAVVWGTGVLLIALSSGSIFEFGSVHDARFALTTYLSPHYVDVVRAFNQVALFLVITGILAVTVRRSRRLVRRQVAIERERSNLVRYFSPNMVDSLAQSDEPFGAVRAQSVGVIFADIVGFTAMAERMAPRDVILMLREFHRLMAERVFARGGTLDKYIGDSVMATFGTPRTASDDARNAFLCARDMVEAIRRWNEERARKGEAPVQVGVGAHYGPVVMGDIGDERCLEFAVIGDTVNVASRLEALTRKLQAEAVVSQDLIDAYHRGTPEEGVDLTGFREGEPQSLRGRGEPVRIWWLPRPSSSSGAPPTGG
ncbi:MAG: adenylate/guanylate cyclase domain-containing protein [Alphaproteobacteria bacterium]